MFDENCRVYLRGYHRGLDSGKTMDVLPIVCVIMTGIQPTLILLKSQFSCLLQCESLLYFRAASAVANIALMTSGEFHVGLKVLDIKCFLTHSDSIFSGFFACMNNLAQYLEDESSPCNTHSFHISSWINRSTMVRQIPKHCFASAFVLCC